MATKLYLRYDTTEPTPAGAHGQGAALASGFWDGDSFAGAYGAGFMLKTTKGSSTDSVTRASVAGPTGGITGQMWTSMPLAAGFTLSGTMTFNIWGLESDAAANMGFVVRVYKLSPDNTLSSAIVTDSAHGTELGTAVAVRNWTASPSSTDFAKGDRIVVFVGYDDAGGNMAASFTGTTRYNGPTDAANGDSWVQLTEDVTFLTAASTGTRFWLNSAASDVSDGTDEREMWTTSPTSEAIATITIPNGPAARTQWTTTAGGTAITWYTKQLTAFTLAGGVTLWLETRVPNGVKGWAYGELALTDDDGGNEQILCYGLMAYVGISPSTMEEGNGFFNRHWGYFAFPDVNVTNGQRLRFRAFVDDNFLWTNTQRTATGDAELQFNTDADVGNGPGSYVRLQESVTEFDPPVLLKPKKPKRIVGPEHLGAVAGTTIYTVPEGGAAWIRHIHIINPTGASRAVWLSIGPDGATTRKFEQRPIAAGGMIEERRGAEHWLNAGEVIQANADAAAACCITIDAIEYGDT